VSVATNMNKKALIKLKPILDNPKFKLVALPGVVGLVVILLVAFVIVPQILNITKINQQMSETDTKSNFFESKITLLQSINSSEYQSDFKTSLVALPGDYEIPDSIGELLSILNSAQFKLESISLSGLAGSADKSVPSYKIRVDISGEGNNLKQFISLMKKTPRLMKISSLSVNYLRNSKDIVASVDVDVYYKALPGSIGDINQKISSLTESDKETLKLIKNNLQTIPIPQEGASSAFGHKQDPFK
jgi:hypothetical protein